MKPYIWPILGLLPWTLGLYYNSSSDYESGTLGAFPSVSFQSSNSTPPAWNFNQYPSTTPIPGYILLAPRGDPTVPTSAQGPMMFDYQGELVWDGTGLIGQTMAFQTYVYNSSSVIAVWQGLFNGAGYGDGVSLLVDDTYRIIAEVKTTITNATNDFHEFRVTPNGTALITIYTTETIGNASTYGISTSDNMGYVLEGHAQEIDIATGQALFTWDSLNYIDPSMCYAAPGTTGSSADNAWDYLHINAIDKDATGNYLISSRHCHAIYYVDKDDGHIIWTLNGKNSSFVMGNGTNFEWQHDSRWQSNFTQISVFDNGATAFATDESQSRGLIINLDMSNMSASLALEMLPYTHNSSQSQGNVQLEPSGNWLIGWGQQPYFAEYDPTGNELWSAQFGIEGAQSYRCFRSNWTAFPTTNPNVSVITNSSTSNYDVYVSWNGATEVTNWTLSGSGTNDGSGLSMLMQTPRTGFETLMSIAQSSASSYQYFQVMASDSSNRTLGFSNFYSTNGTASNPPSSAETSSVATAPVSQTSSATGASGSASASSSASGKSGHAVRRQSMGYFWAVFPAAAGLILACLIM